MQKFPTWWLFLALFGLTIVGIQTLGWWTRPVAAHSQTAPSAKSAASTSAALRHQNCEPRHWRAMVMQQ